jgi:ribosomal protein L34E
MDCGELQQGWQDGFVPVAEAMAQWRQEHPRATLREIEDALDERLATLRSRMLTDTVQTSAAAHFEGLPASQRPRCPRCDAPLVSRGKRDRVLQTTQGQELRIRRDYGSCPSCETALFPPR